MAEGKKPYSPKDSGGAREPGTAHQTITLPLVAFFLLILVTFRQAILGGANISKINMLAEWDSIFAAMRSGQSQLMDPSLIFLMIPSYILKAKFWHEGIVPLWNPYSGFGAPLLADPQALALSILHLPLILNPTLAQYNLVQPIELFIAGASTYLLARHLRLSVFASIFAMLTIAMCPYEQWYLELLGNGFCFVPLAVLAIFRLKASFSPWRSWLSAIALALLIYSAHVEISFCTIALASLSLVLLCCFDREKPGELQSSLKNLTVCGIFTFLLSAPLLLPFIEFIKNSTCYKEGAGAPTTIPWQTFLFNLITPGAGAASPTLGPIALPLLALLPFVCSKWRALTMALAISSLFAIYVMAKIFPVDLLHTYKPFSYIVVSYLIPISLLYLSLLCAIGLEHALEPKGRTKEIAAVLAAALIVPIFPLLARTLAINLNCANFDMCLSGFAFAKGDGLRYSVIAIVFALAFLLFRKRPGKVTAIILASLSIASYLAETYVSHKAIPVRPAFSYQENEAIRCLKETAGTGRSLALGNHLLRPNSNVVFALRDIRMHNPLYPPRFVKFAQAAGANLTTFDQTYDSPLSPLLNLASVKAVIGQTPAISTLTLEGSKGLTSTALDNVTRSQLIPGLILRCGKPQVNWHNKWLSLPLQITTSKNASNNLEAIRLIFVLSDAQGNAYWFSDQLPLSDKTIFRTNAPLPIDCQPGKRLNLSIRYFDTKTNCFLKVAAKPQETGDTLTEIDCPDSESQPLSEPSQYELVKSIADMRVYRNCAALDRAYFVDNAVAVDNEEEALKTIQSPDFDQRHSVVIETAEKCEKQTLRAKESKVNIASDQPNRVEIATESRQPGYLVLTDSYYPGWRAYIDGHPTTILHANYAFRAVGLPSGKHKVVFEFKPLSFDIGLILCLTTLLAPILLRAKKRPERGVSD